MIPKKCAACVWSWGDSHGDEWCKLCLDIETCEGPKEEVGSYEEEKRD